MLCVKCRACKILPLGFWKVRSRPAVAEREVVVEKVMLGEMLPSARVKPNGQRLV